MSTSKEKFLGLMYALSKNVWERILQIYNIIQNIITKHNENNRIFFSIIYCFNLRFLFKKLVIK